MFNAKMVHTEKTCLRLAKIQNACYGRARNTVRLVLAAIPFALGYAAGLDTTAGVLFVVFACMFYYKTSFMYERDAKRAFARTPERFLDVKYEFDEDFFKVQSGGIEKRIEYASVYALVSDSMYIYLFINKQQAYMVEMRTLVSGKAEELCGFLHRKTGIMWKNVNMKERPSFLDFLKRNRETDW